MLNIFIGFILGWLFIALLLIIVDVFFRDDYELLMPDGLAYFIMAPGLILLSPILIPIWLKNKPKKRRRKSKKEDDENNDEDE